MIQTNNVCIEWTCFFNVQCILKKKATGQEEDVTLFPSWTCEHRRRFLHKDTRREKLIRGKIRGRKTNRGKIRGKKEKEIKKTIKEKTDPGVREHGGNVGGKVG
jgi:hypothetical protein